MVENEEAKTREQRRYVGEMGNQAGLQVAYLSNLSCSNLRHSAESLAWQGPLYLR